MDRIPIVSILMTVYNREKFIAEAIESVLNNGFGDFELIIVDDGSRDTSIPIITAYAEQESRLRFYRNEKNLGDYPNRNKAASYARGKYIQFVDSDDMLLPGGLKYTVESMESNPSADFGILCKDNAGMKKILLPGEGIREHFFNKPFLQIGPGGTIIKRDFFEKVGRYPILYGPANDNYFNQLAASEGTVLLLDKDFIFYRIHEGQEINNKLSYLHNGYRYQEDALNRINLGLSPEQLAWVRKKNKRRFFVNMLKHFFTTGRVRQTFQIAGLAGFKMNDIIPALFQSKKKPLAGINDHAYGED